MPRRYLRVLWVEDVACPKTHAIELGKSQSRSRTRDVRLTQWKHCKAWAAVAYAVTSMGSILSLKITSTPGSLKKYAKCTCSAQST